MEGEDFSIIGKPSIFNEDVKMYKDLYVYGKIYYDFEAGATETFGDISITGNAFFSGITTFAGPVDIQQELEQLQVGILTVTEEFYIGNNPGDNVFNVVTYGPYAGWVGIGTTAPTQNLDIIGNARIDGNLYDASNSPGVIGGFLSKDAEGIKWVEFEPSFTEGIFVYNEGVLVGPSSFRGLNFITNSGGSLFELVEGKVNVDNPNIADIVIKDFWEKRPAGLNTSAYVGIGLTNPQNQLEVTGDTKLNGRLTVSGVSTFFERSVFYDGFDVIGSGSTILSPLSVVGVATFEQIVTFKDDVTFEKNVLVEENLEIDNQLYVGAAATMAGSFRVIGVSTFQNNVFVGAGVSIQKFLFVGAGTTLFGTLQVGAAATLLSTLDVLQSVELFDTLEVTGATNLLDTLDVTGATDLQSTLDVVDAVQFDSTLNVDDATTLQTTLGVGAGGTVFTTTGIGSIGIGTADPSRDVDLFRKDIYFNQGAIYDANNQVGFTSENTTDEYRVFRSVLTQVGVGTTGQVIPARFFDAANMIRLNLEYLAGEAVGFITSTSYKDPPFSLSTSNYSSCRDDIKDILRSICFDITRGGNSRSVGAGLSYYNGNTLIHITGTDVNGYSIKEASITAIQKAAEISRYVINNSLYPLSYQMEPINGTYADASRLIFLNKDFIAAEAVDRVLNNYPLFSIPNSNQSCIDDIKLILDAIAYNLSYGGNERVYDATKY
jgi:hypothetical protein